MVHFSHFFDAPFFTRQSTTMRQMNPKRGAHDGGRNQIHARSHIISKGSSRFRCGYCTRPACILLLTMMLSTTTTPKPIRRLSDKDVRRIFECLHDGRDPPANLPFRIVPVNSNGLKLSPPSYEFPDGLYILLRPCSKRPHAPIPTAPKHLHHLLLSQPISDETCPWSLSGPQFPQPTAIQQRYCYPKGNPAYSSQKGGALWTMHDTDGKEDTEFRLLHVYFSAKRAVNKGVVVGDTSVLPSYASPYSRGKRLKRTTSSHPGTTPRRRSSLSSLTAYTERETMGASVMPSSTPPFMTTNHALPKPSPIDSLSQITGSVDPTTEWLLSSSSHAPPPFLTTPSPFRSQNATGESIYPDVVHGYHFSIPSIPSFDLSVSMASNAAWDLSAETVPEERETTKNPYSQEHLLRENNRSSANNHDDMFEGTDSLELQVFRDKIKSRILKAPWEEQGRLVHEVSTWAYALAEDPLK